MMSPRRRKDQTTRRRRPDTLPRGSTASSCKSLAQGLRIETCFRPWVCVCGSLSIIFVSGEGNIGLVDSYGMQENLRLFSDYGPWGQLFNEWPTSDQMTAVQPFLTEPFMVTDITCSVLKVMRSRTENRLTTVSPDSPVIPRCFWYDLTSRTSSRRASWTSLSVRDASGRLLKMSVTRRQMPMLSATDGRWGRSRCSPGVERIKVSPGILWNKLVEGTKRFDPVVCSKASNEEQLSALCDRVEKWKIGDLRNVLGNTVDTYNL
ncbi:hypothetical protein BR93DRAFT_931526 [Coniochaeta sp. PMI_546]|nr:hypothetical protein BR93DRAFT_931526 [Coniochaeta sp. PMI_546]